MYYIVGADGSTQGPFDAPTLRTWIAEGRIPPGALVSGGASVEWVPFAQLPDFTVFQQDPGRSPAGRRKHLITAVIAGSVAVALLVTTAFAAGPLARSGRWGLLPDVIASIFRGDSGGAPRPEKAVRSDVGAVREELLPGIRIDAPAGALDRERSFTARPLDASEIAAADLTLRKQGLVALGGYDIDGGMSDTDLFYEPMEIAFDLEELGIPEELWEDVGIAEMTPDTVFLIDSELDRGVLRIETRHNINLLPVLVPALIGTMIYGWNKDREVVPKGDFKAVYWKADERRYRIMYPTTWPSANEAAVQQAETEYLALLARHGLTSDSILGDPTAQPKADASLAIVAPPVSTIGQIADRLTRLAALYRDPQYKALRKTVRSAAWLKENYFPPRVTNAVISLDRGWEYLRLRGFRRPGVARFSTTTDVYVVESSLGKEVFGTAHNTWTTSPFIILDGTKIPDAREGSFTPEQKVAFDTLQLTALHELFHTVQAAYVFYERNSYLWFNEAAALVLEQEAQSYYTTTKQFAGSWDVTKRVHDSFITDMGHFYPKQDFPNQQHGYGQSFFWEFLRDHYFALGNSRNDFLPKLYEDVASIRGGGIASLYRTTGGTPESLSRVFGMFTYIDAAKIEGAHDGLPTSYKDEPTGPVKTEVTIDKATSPVYQWRFESGGQPLSAQMIKVHIPGAPMQPAASTPNDSVYALSTNGIEQYGAIVRVSVPTAGKKPWEEIQGGCVLPTQALITIMRAETYVETPGAVSGAGSGTDPHGPIVFGMHPGDAPTVEVKDDKVTVTWKPSAAAQVKHDDGSPALISNYRVTLTMPDGTTFTFGANEPKAEIAVELLDKLLKADRRTNKNQLFKLFSRFGERDAITLTNITEALSVGGPPKIKVTYQEVAAVPGAPRGPISAVAEFEYGDEEEAGDDITGMWAGAVPFSEGEWMRMDIIQSTNGDFYGTMHWGEAIPIRGTWNASTQSWAIEGRPENIWMPMFLVFNGHLQKLPGDKLYMFAPPALLSRHSSDVPDLGWQPEEGDIELNDLLQQLQQEMDQMEAPTEGVAP